MTTGRLARALGRLLNVVVLAFSGVYLLLYLYRWEWSRAVVSGLFFVAALSVLLAGVVMNRLDRLERRLLRMLPDERPISPRETPDAPFPWLQPPEGTFVFVPVLMGTGVLLTALAHIVQRLAGTSGAENADLVDPLRRDLPLTNAGLVPPPGGDVARTVLDVAPATADAHELRRRRVNLAIVGVAGTALLVPAIVLLANLTQARPEPRGLGFVTVVELHVAQRGYGQPLHEVGQALQVACEVRLPRGTSATFAVAGPQTIRLTATPALGRTGQKQYLGCLEDTTIDRVIADVRSVERVPAPGPPESTEGQSS